MKKRSLPTIREVAKEAGVSTATVSHVFNKSRWVSPETQKVVLEAAARLNYRPSAIARSLSTNITYSVGVVVADLTNPYFSSLVRGIEDNLWGKGYNLFVCNTDEQTAKEASYLQLLLERRVDGVIIAATGHPQPVYQEFISHQIPLVFVDRRPPERYGLTVETDNYDAGYATCKYLIELGHQQIAFIGRNLFLSTVVGRVSGYRQALLDHRLPVREELIRTTEANIPIACQTAKELLRLPQAPTAIIAGNQIMALGALHAIQDLGLSCPEDVSFIGFDDHPWAPLFSPPLTVVKLPIAEMCVATVEILLNEVDQKRVQSPLRTDSHSAQEEPADQIFKAELILRGSCAPPPLTNPKL